jgi:predicted acetyltransferase
MIATQEVVLERATQADAALLSNLLELYVHDLSEIFPVEIGPDGRFGYEKLSLYWSEHERRFAFLIRSGTRIAGFALVTRGSPMTDDPEALDVAEFFVLRRHRRSGIGRQAATLLWDRFAGQWIVRVSEANRPGLPFWGAVIGAYTNDTFSESRRPGSPHGWRVFSFKSAIPHPGAQGHGVATTDGTRNPHLERKP